MGKKLVNNILTLATVLAMSISPAFAQKISKQELSDNSCEMGLLKFDHALIAFRSAPDTFLIMIVHRSAREPIKLTKERIKGLIGLAGVRGSTKNIIVAEGESVSGLANVEFFINGKLYDTAYFAMNAKSFCDKP